MCLGVLRLQNKFHKCLYQNGDERRILLITWFLKHTHQPLDTCFAGGGGACDVSGYIKTVVMVILHGAVGCTSDS